VVWA